MRRRGGGREKERGRPREGVGEAVRSRGVGRERERRRPLDGEAVRGRGGRCEKKRGGHELALLMNECILYIYLYRPIYK